MLRRVSPPGASSNFPQSFLSQLCHVSQVDEAQLKWLILRPTNYIVRTVETLELCSTL